MNNEEALEMSKIMSESDMYYNLVQARSVPYKKATLLKLKQILNIPVEERTYIGRDILKLRENISKQNAAILKIYETLRTDLSYEEKCDQINCILAGVLPQPKSK